MPDYAVAMDSQRDNVRDHRAGTIDLQAEKSTRKSGFACIALLSGVCDPVDSHYGETVENLREKWNGVDLVVVQFIVVLDFDQSNGRAVKYR